MNQIYVIARAKTRKHPKRCHEDISGNGCPLEENVKVESGVESEGIDGVFEFRFQLTRGLRTNSTPDLHSRNSIFVLDLRL